MLYENSFKMDKILTFFPLIFSIFFYGDGVKILTHFKGFQIYYQHIRLKRL